VDVIELISVKILHGNYVRIAGQIYLQFLFGLQTLTKGAGEKDIMPTTYTPLSEIPKAIIGKCSAMLFNHMQCWRGADVQVSFTVTSKDKDGKDVTKTNIYQLCNAHAAIEQEAAKAAVKK
jgi:hypothetical protein